MNRRECSSSVICNICGLAYILPEDEIVGNLPHVLLCSHIFCTACLRSLEFNNVILCPECQVESNLPEGGVDELQVDSRIIGLIYTAKINNMKSHRGDIAQRPIRRMPLSPLKEAKETQQEENNTEQVLLQMGNKDPLKIDKAEKAVEEALAQASENMAKLENIHQTLVMGLTVQVKREKARLLMEINETMDRAFSVLQKRKGVLLSELSNMEQYFPSSGKELGRVEDRKKSLEIAMQKARQVRQFPSLESYCNLDKVLETLQAPVDVQSFDMSCLSLGCGLSLTKEPVRPQQQCGPSRTGHPPPNHCDSLPSRQEHKWSPRASSQGPPTELDYHCPAADSGPNVIIEEIIEGEQDQALPPPQTTPTNEKQTLQRRKNTQRDGTPYQGKGWVLVMHVVNPNHFYVGYVSERKESVLLSRKINDLCSGDRGLFSRNDTVAKGSVIFVKWKAGVWCRATLTEVFQSGPLEAVPSCPVTQLARIRVFFMDYGYSKDITLQSENKSPDQFVQSLNQLMRRVDVAVQSELRRSPPQAVKCSLKDIVPSDLAKGWTVEAQNAFRQVVGTAAVEMQVFGQETDCLLVDLKKAPMDRCASDMPVSLRDYLLFLEVARLYFPMAWNTEAVQCDRRPLLFYPPVFPHVHTELNAVVSHINTPSDFYIQLVDNMEILLLTSKLQDCYNSAAVQRGGDQGLEVYCPVLEQAVVACYDKVWYRAQVMGHCGGRKVEVLFVDTGNRKVLSVYDLRKIRDEFFALPAMAIKCCLVDVVRLATWTEACIERFKSLADQRLVMAVATGTVQAGMPLPVRLFESGESSGPPANIGKLLVKDSLASFKTGVGPQEAPPVDAAVWDAAVWDPPVGGLCAGDQDAVGPSSGDTGPEDQPAEPAEFQPQLRLPGNLEDLKVRVTQVTSPGSFHVQLAHADPQLKRLCEMLKQEYARSEPQAVDWKADMYCAASVNGVWERGQLDAAVTASNIAEVVRCDFGNTVKLHVDNLRPLLPGLEGSLALKCALSDIRPAGGRATWTATACDFISYYLTGATAIMTIKEGTEQRPVPVSLFCSNFAGQDVSITDFLVSKGLALKMRKKRESPVPHLEETAGEPLGDELHKAHPRDSTDARPALLPTPSKPAPRTNPALEKVKTQPYSPPELPSLGWGKMTISAIGDDGIVYGMTRQAEQQFELLRERLQQQMKTLPRHKPYTWKSVLGCVVMGPDMLWYRGQVMEFIGGQVKVRYVDQGLVESIPVCHVYPKVLCDDVPQLCVPCQLHGVIPVGKSWQWDAVALLKELLLTRRVDVQFMDLPSDSRGCVTVQISLDAMPLSRIMIHHQHASADPSALTQEEYVLTSLAPDLDDWDIDTEGLLELEPVLGVFTYPTLPEEGEPFPVQIKHLRTPTEVFLYPLKGSDDSEVNGVGLEEALTRVNDNRDSLQLLSDFPIEAPCLAEYIDGKYYRAKLLGFSGLNPVKLLIRHVDFGSDDTLPINKLRQIPAHLLLYPCKALKVRVAGFSAPRVSLEQELLPYSPEWSMKAALEMLDLLHGNITASVAAREPDLAVFLFDDSGALVHLPLVEKGLADFE
ncbi:RING finger protein 17 [Aplochiton taeniatus]